MKVQAVVLAAGLSTRMGTSKMLLPWGNSTVLGHVLRTLRAARLLEQVVVVGHTRDSVEAICSYEGALAVFNPAFSDGEMLSSLQIGLQALPPECEAALIVLGDQPTLQVAVVQAVLELGGTAHSASLRVPSYKRQRGHPWLVGSDWWQELLGVRAPETARDFLRRHAERIEHVEVNTDSILRDIDAPEDYLHSAP